MDELQDNTIKTIRARVRYMIISPDGVNFLTTVVSTEDGAKSTTLHNRRFWRGTFAEAIAKMWGTPGNPGTGGILMEEHKAYDFVNANREARNMSPIVRSR
jgi:hypothetical protein